VNKRVKYKRRFIAAFKVYSETNINNVNTVKAIGGYWILVSAAAVAV